MSVRLCGELEDQASRGQRIRHQGRPQTGALRSTERQWQLKTSTVQLTRSHC